MLLDGRNRREAAKLAGIIPPVIVTDVDPKLAVHRSNNQNRDATPGQKAMRWAMLYPGIGKHGGARNSSVSAALEFDEVGFSKRSFAMARYVWHKNPKLESEKHPQLAKDVAAGLITLTEAYELTQADVKRREAEEAIRQANAAKLADVRVRYPDLAALVDDERITLTDAVASAESRDLEAAIRNQPYSLRLKRKDSVVPGLWR